jgi:hypothetical protein
MIPTPEWTPPPTQGSDQAPQVDGGIRHSFATDDERDKRKTLDRLTAERDRLTAEIAAARISLGLAPEPPPLDLHTVSCHAHMPAGAPRQVREKVLACVEDKLDTALLAYIKKRRLATYEHRMLPSGSGDEFRCALYIYLHNTARKP